MSFSRPSATDAPTEDSATPLSSNAYDTYGSAANTATTPVSAGDPLIVSPSSTSAPSKAFETSSPSILERG